MSAQRKAPTVEMGDEGAMKPPPKPVSEMSDGEKADYRKQVLADLESQTSAGNKNMLSIKLESGGYEGTINIRRPSLDEQREIGIRAAKYLQGVVGVDLRTDNLALFFATFDVLVDWNSAPEWFNPRKMFDYRLLEYVYGRWTSWVQSFREFVPPEQKGDSEAKGDAA